MVNPDANEGTTDVIILFFFLAILQYHNPPHNYVYSRIDCV